LGDVDDESENFMGVSPLWSNEQASPHYDRSQVNDWESSNQNRWRKTASGRTAVKCKDDHRRHQDGPIRVGTDDPSSPDNNAIGDDKLLIKEKIGRRVKS